MWVLTQQLLRLHPVQVLEVHHMVRWAFEQGELRGRPRDDPLVRRPIPVPHTHAHTHKIYASAYVYMHKRKGAAWPTPGLRICMCMHCVSLCPL